MYKDMEEGVAQGILPAPACLKEKDLPVSCF